QRVLALEPANTTARNWLDKLLQAAEEENEEYKCPFCCTASKTEFDRCAECGAFVSLDLDAIFRNEGVDDKRLRSAIQYLKGLPGAGEFHEVQYYLGLAYLNLLDSNTALKHFRRTEELYSDGPGVRETIDTLSRRRLILIVDDSITIRTL